ncbi:hypothetical protein ACIGW0_31445 [Streptomyces bikiniensis]|uniref:Uncharacterized protein n=1 Tax=Streptomyces bikiniensis TaxID=1896 RepID=A0ABW8D4C5_STRBI
MSDLVSAGAPELPEGYFYRVRPAVLVSAFFVEVRRRNRFIGSTELASILVYPSDHPSATEAIVTACREACLQWRESETARAVYREAERFRGDHDPRGGR